MKRDINELISYIVEKHHNYVEQEIPVLLEKLRKIAHVHGEEHCELNEIKDLFDQSARELLFHMKKEEMVLFPYIRQLVKSDLEQTKLASPPFKTVQMPVKIMMKEHAQEETRFAQISKLSSNFTPPEDACESYKMAFKMLENFNDDLKKHIDLENNILFPEAIRLEETLSMKEQIEPLG